MRDQLKGQISHSFRSFSHVYLAVGVWGRGGCHLMPDRKQEEAGDGISSRVYPAVVYFLQLSPASLARYLGGMATEKRKVRIY